MSNQSQTLPPNEMLAKIFDYIPCGPDWAHVVLVCKTFYQVSKIAFNYEEIMRNILHAFVELENPAAVVGCLIKYHNIGTREFFDYGTYLMDSLHHRNIGITVELLAHPDRLTEQDYIDAMECSVFHNYRDRVGLLLGSVNYTPEFLGYCARTAVRWNLSIVEMLLSSDSFLACGNFIFYELHAMVMKNEATKYLRAHLNACQEKKRANFIAERNAKRPKLEIKE